MHRFAWITGARVAGLAATATALTLVSVASAAPAPAAADFPAGKGRDVFLRTCGGCHPPAIVKSHPHDEDGWDDTIGKMVQRGAKASDAEQDEIRAYLAHNFPPAPKAGARKPGG